MKRTSKRAGVILAMLILSMFYFCGCNEDVAPSISVNPTTISVDCNLQSIPILITSNRSWKAKIIYRKAEETVLEENEWCHLSKGNGNGSGGINIVVDDCHYMMEARNAVIYFETLGDDYEVAAVQVIQHGEDSWSEKK
ncbi:hypothetical protein [uncultured Bacteroides sp.]|uniref:hypothetical protein n=1 Tax=uncultured Bacteroides sp. TaxID=162156 RepID=UPI00280B3E86|nr:hypothetical protein [uncultured Bacteroides sp.]